MNNNSQETPMNNRPANHLSPAAPEESSWTSYFEEFLWQKKNDDEQDVIMSTTCDHHETLKSLISDAASSVNKAVCFQDDDHAKS
ncbi:hypothetical protein OSB04_003973 [Centaurea solstitialis]|uniref:Uncharacterized protein n=1 Tax=Centaurea solstitialis TaxID=347529 RepID=A0AA38WNQ5_9ASTR|nr:hypothetical protein OSB04_003973 [Centaurea solstitialis]